MIVIIHLLISSRFNHGSISTDRSLNRSGFEKKNNIWKQILIVSKHNRVFSFLFCERVSGEVTFIHHLDILVADHYSSFVFLLSNKILRIITPSFFFFFVSPKNDFPNLFEGQLRARAKMLWKQRKVNFYFWIKT
jgi:hypothetical protein